MKKIIQSSVILSAFLPFVAYALTQASVTSTNINCPGNGKTLCTVINIIIGYANQILLLMMGVAIVMFVFYVIKYYIKSDANRVDGGKYVMYSLIGFFVILSFWGLINILQNSFGLQNDSAGPKGWSSFMQIFPSGGNTSPNRGGVNELGNP